MSRTIDPEDHSHDMGYFKLWDEELYANEINYTLGGSNETESYTNTNTPGRYKGSQDEFTWEANGVAHEFEDDLKRAKHPLLDKNECVPIDINLGDKYNVIIITGPNTGGKTVTLKTVGLLLCMAYCGLNIPAQENSSIYVFDDIASTNDELKILADSQGFIRVLPHYMQPYGYADGFFAACLQLLQ